MFPKNIAFKAEPIESQGLLSLFSMLNVKIWCCISGSFGHTHKLLTKQVPKLDGMF